MRHASIDVLRTVAIFVMVLVHFGENLSGYTPPLAGFGAPLFALLSGASYRLWSEGRRRRGDDEETISRVTLRRGLFIFGFGFAFNLFVWLPEGVFNWDVLTFVGSAIILLDLVRRMPASVAIFAASLAVLVAPAMRHLVDYHAYWTQGYFDCDLELSEVLIGYLVCGYFPIFPWIAFSIAGFVVAGTIFPTDRFASTRDRAPRVLAIGSALLAISLILRWTRPMLPTLVAKGWLGGWTMFPPTSEYVLGMLGVSLMLLAFCHRTLDGTPPARLKAALGVAKTFSRYSLTIYVAHHVVHLWPLWIWSVATGHEATELWQKAMPIAWSLPLAIAFMLVCYAVLRRLGSERTYGFERAMRWLCD